jgi:hypothetical protein
MTGRHRKTLQAIFSAPTPATLEWARIEALFTALGAQTIEGRGSRVAFVIHDRKADFHRPHPGKEAKRYQVRAAREFLEKIGVVP